jgi:uncharacterized protein (DUF1810 family)
MTDLERFVRAQDEGGSWSQALAELKAGRKRTHWMWFVFPQLAGLGRSQTARYYALAGLDDAQRYLAHPVLGPRLLQAAGAMAELDETDAVRVLGPVDAQKLHSSMTLFRRADPDQPVFADVLGQYFDGVEDEGTTGRL